MLLILALICGSMAQAATPMLALGQSHAVALREDGKVLAWGSDDSGQLGSGRLPFSVAPGRVAELQFIKSIGAGVEHALAVRNDGTAWAWGKNDEGQLGGGPSVNQASPVKVQGIEGVAMACGGSSFSLALRGDGTVWSWGAGYQGELGQGQTAVVTTPAQVSGLSAVTSIVCGNFHALAMRQDGAVLAWGSNEKGALGDGSTTSRSVPVLVHSMTDVRAIAAGNQFSAALRADGTVWEWGVRNGGAGVQGAPRTLAQKTEGLSGVGAIAASLNNFSLVAIQAGGQRWWNWQTGAAPVVQDNVCTLQSAAYAYGQFLLLCADQRVFAGGGGGFGSLGDGTTDYRDTPRPVIGQVAAAAVASGSFFGMALDSAGQVWSWGLDTQGQLGHGRLLGRPVPALVSGLADVVQVTAGNGHSLAVDQAGSVWAWGDNGYAQLGDGSYLSVSKPMQLTTLSGVAAVSAGSLFSLALKRDGTVWQWGASLPGQFDDPAIPTQVLDRAIAVSAGASHSLTLRQDGTVWSWGGNEYGQLGDGTTQDQLRPRMVAGLFGVRCIAASQSSNYAVLADGTVKAWGDNTRGQLGDGTTVPRLGPVVVRGLTDVIELVAGRTHALARQRDGSVWGWSWDYGTSGELGVEPSEVLSVAAKINGLSSIRHAAAGDGVSAALRDDGKLVMGGKNFIGQLGDGTFALRQGFGLVINPNADGFLELATGVSSRVAPALNVPFYLVAAGAISNTSAIVKSTTTFNPADQGKAGAVYITASVPTGSSLARSALAPGAAAGLPPIMSEGATPAAFTLLQLTPSGWQTVTNNQLLPYASGVLGDQLAAQTILNNIDTSTLKGAEFCVGYGSSAQDMVASGNIRAVATIPGAIASSSCVVGGTLSVALRVVPGWNLLGNPVNQRIAVAATFADAGQFNSVWKWDSTTANWQLYAPSMSASALQSYAASLGYAVLDEIQPGDGFWVNAKTQAELGTFIGTAINLRQSSFASGWNLVATASTITPQDFNLSMSTTPPMPGQVPINLTSLWAWDNALSKWYFYAPSLETDALERYIQEHGYRDFGGVGSTMGSGVGFWVKRP